MNMAPNAYIDIWLSQGNDTIWRWYEKIIM